MTPTGTARRVFLISVFLGLVFGADSQAAVPPAYRWTQTGTIGIVLGGTWDGSLAEGTPFTATLDYRSTSSSSYPPGTKEARYDDVAISAKFIAGNYNFQFDEKWPGFSPSIGVFDNQTFGPLTADGYSWHWQTPEVQYGLHDIFLSGFYLSGDLTTVTSPALDIHEFPVSQFNYQRDRQLVAYDANGNLHILVCYVDDYFIEPIPEPATWLLLGSAWCIAAARLPARRRAGRQNTPI